MPDLDPNSDIPAVPAPPASRRFSTRDLLICVGLAMLLLVLFEGHSIRHAGQELKSGWQRTLVLAVGRPAGWASDELYLNDLKGKLTAWLRPGGGLGSSGPGGFNASAGAAAGATAAITPDAFDPAALGQKPRAPAPLKTMLVTGDSMSQPLDATLARGLAQNGSGVKTIRDAHLGTGISKTDLVDWGRLSVAQVKQDHPNAVVMFIGANEGFPMPVAGGKPVNCCSPAWAAEYARRVRAMMNTYRQAGVARVYWLTLPGPRESARQPINRAVNAAIAVAAAPYRAQVRVLDMAAIFTPGGKYRDAMAVGGGAPQIVREPDGIHLNQAGADLAATAVQAALRADYGTQAGS